MTQSARHTELSGRLLDLLSVTVRADQDGDVARADAAVFTLFDDGRVAHQGSEICAAVIWWGRDQFQVL